MNELVSVIMPTFNNSSYLKGSIESVLSQTYSNLELLITDDCSSETEVRSIIEEYVEKDSRVKAFFFEENRGVASARNNCIREAKGRYIAFCDSDDSWVKTKLEKQLSVMEQKSCALCYSPYYVCDNCNCITGIVYSPKTITLRKLKRDNKIGCSTAVVDISKFGKQYMPNLRKRQDWAFFLSILQRCQVAYSADEPLAIYRRLPDSLSHNKFSLLKYNAAVYRTIFGYGILKSYLYLLVIFCPNYIFKKFMNRIYYFKAPAIRYF